MTDFIFSNQWVMLVVFLGLLLGLAEVGYRVGLRLYQTKDEARRSQISGVQGATLGLLGLLLGFTFAMAASRYETRRDLVLKESNAVGTAWLRAGLLPEAHREPVRDLFRRYVDVRVKYEALMHDPVQLAEGLRQGSDLQNQLWQRAEAAAKDSPTLMTALFIAALNDVIDVDAERMAAGRNDIPTGVWVLLIVVAGFGCYTSGYGSGAQGARSVFTDLFLPVLIAVVIALIFDLTHSRQGVIGVSQKPMLDLQQSIQPKPSK